MNESKDRNRTGRTYVAVVLLATALCIAGIIGVHAFPPAVQQAQAGTAIGGSWTAKAGTGGTISGRFVKLEAAGTIITATAVGDYVVGVCETTAAVTKMTTYAPIGTVATVTSGEAIAVGDLLAAGTGGKAFKLGTDYAITQRYGAVALTAAGAADVSVTCIVAPGATSVLASVPCATVAAAGTTQTDAAAVATGFTLVSAADDAKGVKLPAAAAGKMCILKSSVSNKILKVWPNTDDAINAIAANGSMSLASGPTSVILVCYDATTWYTVPLLPS